MKKIEQTLEKLMHFDAQTKNQLAQENGRMKKKSTNRIKEIAWTMIAPSRVCQQQRRYEMVK